MMDSALRVPQASNIFAADWCDLLASSATLLLPGWSGGTRQISGNSLWWLRVEHCWHDLAKTTKSTATFGTCPFWEHLPRSLLCQSCIRIDNKEIGRLGKEASSLSLPVSGHRASHTFSLGELSSPLGGAGIVQVLNASSMVLLPSYFVGDVLVVQNVCSSLFYSISPITCNGVIYHISCVGFSYNLPRGFALWANCLSPIIWRDTIFLYRDIHSSSLLCTS